MKNKKQLQVGKTYRATDTGNVFVATEADVKGATLANSTHLYEEVDTDTCPNCGSSMRNHAFDSSCQRQAPEQPQGQQKFTIPKEVSEYRNINQFLERHDRRTNAYKLVDGEVERIAALFGSDSKELNEFMLTQYSQGQHTPGEWFVDYGEFDRTNDAGELLVRIDGGDERYDVCNFQCDETGHPKANAARIVQCVNSFDALQKSNDYYKGQATLLKDELEFEKRSNKTLNDELAEALRELRIEAMEWRDYCVREAASFDHPAQEQERRMCIDSAACATRKIEKAEKLLAKATQS